MRVDVLCLVVLVFANRAGADPVPVSAVDHGAFTRVILGFTNPTQVRTRRQGNFLELRFPNGNVPEFDLSRVFRTIDRTRLADVHTTFDGRMNLELACECDVVPRSEQTGAFTLDIFEPGEPSETLAQNADRQSLGDFLAGSSVGPTVEYPALPEEGISTELLARAFARAAAQGLIAPADDVKGKENGSTVSRLRVLAGRGNLSVTTSFDQATQTNAGAIPPTSRGTICIPDRYVDVGSWGDANDKKMLGRLRRNAISEDGGIDPDGARSLARYYIYLGFGAEARVTIRNSPPSLERDVIEALAEIFDSGRSEAPVLVDQVDCKGAVSLWAILAAPLEASAIPISTNDALAAFAALPPHLRAQLGPVLSRRLQDAGLTSEARTAINAVTRSGTHTDESELASARLELDGTHDSAARTKLAELSNGTDLTAARALLELLLDAERRNMTPNPTWVEDAPTLVGALEGTGVAEKLNVAGLRALAAIGRFDEFRSAIVEESPGVTQAVRKELALYALRTALSVGEDDVFLSTEVGLSKIVSADSLARDERLAMSQRLFGLGLASRAFRYIQPNPETPEETAAAIHVLLALGRVESALDLVSDASFDGALPLRARTFVAAGKEELAIDAYLSGGDKDNAEQAALRMGNWNWFSENSDSAISSAVRSLASEVQSDPVEDEGANGALIRILRDRRERARVLMEITRPAGRASAFTN